MPPIGTCRLVPTPEYVGDWESSMGSTKKGVGSGYHTYTFIMYDDGSGSEADRERERGTEVRSVV